MNAQPGRKIPEEARELLQDLAEIRRIVLEQSPGCLPLLAASLVRAEQRVRDTWGL
jgi:hypothetical protein